MALWLGSTLTSQFLAIWLKYLHLMRPCYVALGCVLIWVVCPVWFEELIIKPLLCLFSNFLLHKVFIINESYEIQLQYKQGIMLRVYWMFVYLRLMRHCRCTCAAVCLEYVECFICNNSYIHLILFSCILPTNKTASHSTCVVVLT